MSCLAGSVIVGRISFMFAPEQCSRELSLRATAPVFHAVWRLRLPCIARASRRVYYPLERLVTGLLACGSGRSASRVIGTASRSLSAPRRVGLRIVLFEACSAFTRVTACTLALSPIRDTHSEGFSYFVTSMPAPVASGWSGRRVGLAPTGKRRLFTAHVESECGAGGFRPNISVAAPFVWRCLTSSPVALVSTPRSSNRTCRSPASGSRTRSHAFTHEGVRRTSRKCPYRCESG